MAEGGVSEGKSLGELESEITCSICQEHYNEPKVLPCLHYFCKNCILLLAHRAGTGKPFFCPECRSQASLPEGGVDDLKSAFFVNRLRDKVSTIEQSQYASITAKQANSKMEVKCELCTDFSSIAEAFCRQCARFVCMQCSKLHTQIQKYANHEIASLNDLRSGHSNPIPVKETHIEKCQDHEKPLKVYCFTCIQFICHDCISQTHQDHLFESSEKAASDTKTELLELVKPVKLQQVQLSNAVEKVRVTKLRVESDKKSAIQKISTSIKELHLLLDKQEQELVNKIEVMTQRKVFSLSMQEKTLSMASEEVQRVVEDTEQVVRHSTDNEVMKIHPEVRKKIEHTILDGNTSRRNMEPVEEADLMVMVKDTRWKELVQSGIIVMENHQIDPIKYTLDAKNAAEINKASIATLTTSRSSEFDIPLSSVSCQLTSYNGVTTSCEMTKTESGIYSIQYTPTVHGSHELTVQINGKHVTGSPFLLVAFTHPSKLGEPLEVWKIVRPVCITSNSQGDVMVCRQNGSVVQIPMNKQKPHVLFNINGKLQQPSSMACDKNNCIYIIDSGSPRMLIFKENKATVRTVSLKVFPGRSALCIINDRLMIGETNSKNIIKVYNGDLNYLDAFEHRDIGFVKNLTADDQGQLYVTNQLNQVLIFTEAGVFIQLFTLSHLQKFSSLCLWNDHLLVTGYGCYGQNCAVRVFSKNGSFITSFGRHGRGEGCFRGPIDICVNKHGFIYVCDVLNLTVQCF